MFLTEYDIYVVKTSVLPVVFYSGIRKRFPKKGVWFSRELLNEIM